MKNYLEQESRKRSGWSAMKSVVSWAGRTFEVQVQPLYRALLRWLFVDPSAEPPLHEGVEVVLTE